MSKKYSCPIIVGILVAVVVGIVIFSFRSHEPRDERSDLVKPVIDLVHFTKRLV